MIKIPKVVYIIMIAISTFFILSTILNFFEIPPDTYLIYIIFIIVLILFYIFLPVNIDTYKIFSNTPNIPTK